PPTFARHLSANELRRAIVWLAAKNLLYPARPSGRADLPGPPDVPGLSVGLLADLILLEFLVQIAARRADHLGGLRDVPPVLAELADQEHPFGVLFELSQRPRLPSLAVARLLRRGKPAAPGRRPRGWRPDGLGQVGDVDGVAGGHDDHPLDRVPQLTDVA